MVWWSYRTDRFCWKVLEELKCLDKAKILILNKIDLAKERISSDVLEEKISTIKEKYSNYEIIITSVVDKYN